MIPTPEQIIKRIEELKTQREQVIGILNAINGAIMALEQVIGVQQFFEPGQSPDDAPTGQARPVQEK